MKKLKVLGVVVAMVVILLVVAVGSVFAYIDSIAKHAVERGGTYALGVPTQLTSADVRVFGGSFEMQGLNVENPSGFTTPHFLNLGKGGVSVSLGTLRSDVVELPTLTLSGISLNLERTGGKTNYGVILDNVKKLESGEKPAEPAPSSGKEKLFVIRKVEITDINVHAALSPVQIPVGGAGDLTKLDIVIPRIVLTDVGSGSQQGLPMRELATVIVKAVLSAVVEKAGNILPADLLNDLQGQLANLSSLQDLGIGMASDAVQQVGERLSEAVEGVTQQAEKAAEDLKDAAGKAVDDAKREVERGIGNLLPGGRREGGN